MTVRSDPSSRFNDTVAALPCAAFGRGRLSRFQFTGDGAGRHALGDAFLGELGFLSNFRTGAAAPGFKLLSLGGININRISICFICIT
jgi:hypothetical protein